MFSIAIMELLSALVNRKVLNCPQFHLKTFLSNDKVGHIALSFLCRYVPFTLTTLLKRHYFCNSQSGLSVAMSFVANILTSKFEITRK